MNIEPAFYMYTSDYRDHRYVVKVNDMDPGDLTLLEQSYEHDGWKTLSVMHISQEWAQGIARSILSIPVLSDTEN